MSLNVVLRFILKKQISTSYNGTLNEVTTVSFHIPSN
jgi:hypothetical protein